MERLPRLKVNGAVLSLHQDIVHELPIIWNKFGIGLFGTVVRIMLRIHKSPPNYIATIRLQGLCHHIGTLNVVAFIVLWPRLTFGIGLYQKSSKIWNECINFSRFFIPPLLYILI